MNLRQVRIGMTLVGSGVVLGVNLFQPLGADMSIDLSRRNVGMSQQGLQ